MRRATAESVSWAAANQPASSAKASASAAVLHQHQHFDGSGFPQMSVRRGSIAERVEGMRIHVFGRILLVADLYERLTLTRIGLPPSAQMRELVSGLLPEELALPGAAA